MTEEQKEKKLTAAGVGDSGPGTEGMVEQIPSVSSSDVREYEQVTVQVCSANWHNQG